MVVYRKILFIIIISLTRHLIGNIRYFTNIIRVKYLLVFIGVRGSGSFFIVILTLIIEDIIFTVTIRSTV